MNTSRRAAGRPLSPQEEMLLDQQCNAFEDACKAGVAPRIEDELQRVSPELRPALLHEMLAIEAFHRHGGGPAPSPASPPSAAEPDLSPTALNVDESSLAGAEGGNDRPAPPIRAGNYELIEPIAQGGMGVVYRARDIGLDREVAVKVVRDRFSSDSDIVRRFVEEARITGQLQHPGIPPIHDVGVLPDGRPYLAMKLIKGRTLAALLAERTTPAEDLDRFVRIFEQICLAMAFAHDQGVIHRDLKPANVMVGSFGEVQVMDWGLAKLLGEAGPANSLAADGAAAGYFAATQHGAVLGTLPYMPPEQARGEIDRLDARCDVFGLGAILCVILTGKPPYTDGDANVLYQRACEGALSDAFERVQHSGAPVLVKKLAMRCLAADPKNRPAHAGEVVTAIRHFHRIVETSKRKSELYDATTVADERRKTARRTARMAITIGIIALAAAFVFTWGSEWWVDRFVGRPTTSREEKSQDLAVREWAERPNRARQAFPAAIDELAKDASAGTFRRGADAQARAASIRRFERALDDLDPKDQARGYLALGAAAPSEEAFVNDCWKRAAARYRSAMPSSTEVDLAIAAVSWDFPAPLTPTVLRQASAKLRSALARKELSDGMRVKVTKSLAIADQALRDQ